MAIKSIKRYLSLAVIATFFVVSGIGQSPISSNYSIGFGGGSAFAAVNFQQPRVQIFDSNGDPVAGALVYFFDAGTTTPRTTYSDDGLSVANAHPVVADSAGRLNQIFLQTGTYKVRITNSAGTTIYEEDDVDPSLSTNAGALAVASGGTGATTAAGARTNLGAYSTTSGAALELRVDDVEALLDAPILAAAETQTFAASFTPVFTAFETRAVTLTDNVTINAPTVTAGQKIRLILIQDATGNRVATWNSAFKWPSGLTGVLSTTASAIDVLEGYARTTGEIQVTSFKRQDVLSDVAIVEENQTSATAGGTFTSGADRTRTLNTEVTDLVGLVTLSSNQFTITNAGTYEISWEAPAYRVDAHQSFLYNITSAAEVKRGTTEYATGDTAQNKSIGSTVVVLAASAAFEIRHRGTTTRATDGFGKAASFGTEVFTKVKIRKLK
jgi:hypothetical protein